MLGAWSTVIERRSVPMDSLQKASAICGRTAEAKFCIHCSADIANKTIHIMWYDLLGSAAWIDTVACIDCSFFRA